MTEPRAPFEMLERELGTSEPEAIVELVRSMELQLSDLYREKEYNADGEPSSQYERVASELYAFYLDRDRLRERYGVDTSEDLMALIDSMEEQLAELYAGGGADEAPAPNMDSEEVAKLRRAVEMIQRELKVSSAYDVVDLVRSMEEQLVELYRDRESTEAAMAAIEEGDPVQQLQGLYAKLEVLQRELGVEEPADVVELVRSMEEQLAELYADREEVEARLAQRTDGDAAEQVEALRAQLDVLQRELGVGDASEAVMLVQSMEDQLSQLYADQERLTEHDIADIGMALDMIENMQEQLSELYRDKEVTEAAMAAMEEGDPVQQLQGLYAKLEVLQRELGVEEPADVVELVRSMEDQLIALYEAQEQLSADGLPTQEEVAEMIGNLESQLAEFYEEREQLARSGIADVPTALEMIRSMEEQLTVLYRDQEIQAATDVGDLYESDDLPETALNGFRMLDAEIERSKRYAAQLSHMRAEVQNLRVELELAGTMRDQLESFESRLDQLQRKSLQTTGEKLLAGQRLVDLTRNLEHQLRALQSEKGKMTESGLADVDEALTLIGSLQAQLRTLYAEKQQLLSVGSNDPDELIAMIDRMEDRIARLTSEKEQAQHREALFLEELGMTDPHDIIKRVRKLENKLEAAAAQVDFNALLGPALDAKAPEVAVPKGPQMEPFVGPDLIAQLDALSPEQIRKLRYGIVRLDSQGTIRFLHEHEEELGGLDAPAAEGRHFFREALPSANSRIFYGRFKQGQREGRVNAAFPYTLTDAGRPINLLVQVSRRNDASDTWIFLKRS